MVIEYSSTAGRDGALSSGMDTGMVEGYPYLDDLLADQLRADHSA